MKTCIIKDQIVDLLKKQIKMENQASAQYLSMATFCDSKGYQGSAKFLYSQSDEERQHMLKLVKYLAKEGIATSYPDLENQIETQFQSLKSVFELAMKNELEVTSYIHKINKACFDFEDYATQNLIQWFVNEQIEEKTTIQYILDIFSLFENVENAKFFIDQEIGKIR